MAQRATGRLPAGRNIANQLDAVRIRRLAAVQFVIGSLHAINDRRQSNVPHEASPRVGVNGTYSRSYLVVGVSRDVFHKKVNQTSIALQRLQNLQRSVRKFDLGWLR